MALTWSLKRSGTGHRNEPLHFLNADLYLTFRNNASDSDQSAGSDKRNVKFVVCLRCCLGQCFDSFDIISILVRVLIFTAPVT